MGFNSGFKGLNVPWIFPRSKAAGRVLATQLLDAQVKNKRRYTSRSLICLHDVDRKDFTVVDSTFRIADREKKNSWKDSSRKCYGYLQTHRSMCQMR